MPNPILPRRPADPTGADSLERAAIADVRSRLNKIKKAYQEGLESIPVSLVVNAKYAYRLDPATLSSILSGAGATAEALLLEGSNTENLWIFRSYVKIGYQRGTQQEWANLANQSSTYKATYPKLTDLLGQPEYRSRVAMIAAREYEEMEGLLGDTRKNLGRILTDGVTRGRNPRQIAKDIAAQTDIQIARARRIARTEVTTALRRARWDEHDEAKEGLGLRFKLMHYSALSPTTRKGHAERHALLYTSEEVRDWYATDGNSINCKCTQISVLVDEHDNPVAPRIVERARETEKKMRAREAGPWSQKAA